MSIPLKSLATLLAIAPGLTLAAPRPDRTIERAASGTQTALVTVTPTGGEFFGDITVDGKVHKVLFDTGSNDLWINNHGQKGSGPFFHEGYGSGAVNGTIEHGEVTVGGITVRNQAYGLVYEASGDDARFDGILGLGSARSQFRGQEPSWLQNVAALLKAPVFAVDLAPGAPGTVAFGYDPHQSSSDGADGNAAAAAAAAPLPLSTTNAGWDIAARLPGMKGNVNCDLDTGTTDLVIPASARNAYFRAGCSDDMPAFEVASNGRTFSMPGKYATAAHGRCGDRVENAPSEDYCILGQPFLFAFHTVFDFANRSVSLKPKA